MLVCIVNLLGAWQLVRELLDVNKFWEGARGASVRRSGTWHIMHKRPPKSADLKPNKLANTSARPFYRVMHYILLHFCCSFARIFVWVTDVQVIWGIFTKHHQ